MGLTQWKRKLRGLKKLERRIRFGDESVEGKELVWSRFFSTERPATASVKYPLEALLVMDRSRWKEALEEYFYHVYYAAYKDGGLARGLFDPELLAAFELAPAADADQVKRRFRELAKKYHPDQGGDHDKMIELLETYRRLLR
jgi:DnaJ-domain-containing protein 1